MGESHTLAVFIFQLIVLILVGRLIGEGMSRIGQPAIFRQLLAGVALSPSLFGAHLPDLHEVIFAQVPELKQMIDAISQIGTLMLLDLTRLERSKPPRQMRTISDQKSKFRTCS